VAVRGGLARRIAVCAVIGLQALWVRSEALAGEPSPGPPVWGVAWFTGYAAGSHEAPNGLAFNPLVALGSDLNVGLLPAKKLYLFLDSDLWVKHSAAGAPATSQREFDADFGLAWNYFDALELRGSLYAFNNLNRGFSLARPDGYRDGSKIENRYYFGATDAYDVGKLPFVGIGYYPTQTLVGNNGQDFHLGLFARGYLTQDLPAPFRSYFYAGVQVTAENTATPRLLDTDFGLAVRPLAEQQGIELRVGYDRNDDVQAHVTRQLVYGSLRIGFGLGSSSPSPSEPSVSWPETWGVVGLPVYAAGNRMGPNGVSYRAIFAVTEDLNLGLLPKKQLYIFSEGDFWAQHSNPQQVTQGSFGFSKRELDSELGLAWNYFDSFELRGSGYALNNLNRGVSSNNGTGGKEGIKLEDRYYFPTSNLYDVGRASFLGLGYIPTEDLVGGDGASFRPGLFARSYLTGDLPISWLASYLYAGQQITARSAASPRLIDTDLGWAVRPLARYQNLELRIGYDLVTDVHAHTARNVIYAAVRLGFDPAGFGRLSGFGTDGTRVSGPSTPAVALP